MLTAMFEPLPFNFTLTTQWLGRPLFFVREVDSTNRLLREMAREGAAAGTVVITDHQVGGRGRRGRSWTTPPGSSLLSSTLWRPLVWTARHALLPIVTAVAIARTLEGHLELQPEIKWPNDILLAGRKCCGILIESEWQQPNKPLIVVGIGLNVKQTAEDFVDLPTATSLRLAQGKGMIERGALLAALLKQLERAYDEFEIGWQPHNAWRKRATWLGEMITVYPAKGEAWQGVARDLAEDGALLVERADGRRVRLSAGDVSVRQDVE